MVRAEWVSAGWYLDATHNDGGKQGPCLPLEASAQTLEYKWAENCKDKRPLLTIVASQKTIRTTLESTSPSHQGSRSTQAGLLDFLYGVSIMRKRQKAGTGLLQS